MKLEDSNGDLVANPTPEQIRNALAEVGARIDHCILHLDDGAFVQSAGSHDQLSVQYSDGGTLMESATQDFDTETVAQIFVEAMEGKTSWKSDYTFAPMGGGDAGSAPDGSQRSGLGGLGGQSMKDQLLNSVKREVNREVSRGVGGIVRKVIRSVTGR